jgi:selenide,water dikinase
MASASSVTLLIDSARLPLLDGVLAMASQNRSGGMTTNREHFAGGISFDATITPALRDIIFDPQTSGGLLFAVDQPHTKLALAALRDAGIAAVEIGEALSRKESVLEIR